MSDKVVLVTGGASGIGFACARRFFNDGYKVVIADSNEAEGLRALDDLGVASDKQDAGTQAIFVHCDISDKLAVHKAVVRQMVEEIDNRDDRSGLSQRPYSIINMSSINEDVAIPDYLAYTVSKGGMRQMTRAMALELAPRGIRVNAIGPGSIKTNMLAGVSGDKTAHRSP